MTGVLLKLQDIKSIELILIQLIYVCFFQEKGLLVVPLTIPKYFQMTFPLFFLAQSFFCRKNSYQRQMSPNIMKGLICPRIFFIKPLNIKKIAITSSKFYWHHPKIFQQSSEYVLPTPCYTPALLCSGVFRKNITVARRHYSLIYQASRC